MNKIRVFQNAQFGNVRVAMNESNEPMFCLADLCQVLDLTPSKVAQRLDKDVLSKYPVETIGGIQQANFVNEDGLYDAILDSRKPEAKQFRKWITSEVLPAIRKYGAYMTGETLAKMLQNPDNLIELLTALKSEQERNAALSIQNEANTRNIEAMKPKAVYYDNILQSSTLIQTDIIAARLGISAIKLNRTLCELGVQFKRGDVYVLRSDLRNNGFVGYKEYLYTDEISGKKKSKPHMYWTEKGAAFIINLYHSTTLKLLN